MDACKRFLDQLNREKIVTLDVTGLCLEDLAQKLEELLENPIEGYVAICWENVLSTHTFCKGLRDLKKQVPSKALADREKFTVLTYEGVRKLLMQKCSNQTVRWFYPYPSLTYTTHIFSDRRLPQEMECEDNYDNFETAALECFDERSAIGTIAGLGMYQQLANAYLVVIGDSNVESLPDYARFSTQRRKEKQILTTLSLNGVTKSAYTNAANAHIQNLKQVQSQLEKLFAGTKVFDKELLINAIETEDFETEAKVTFRYEQGESLETKLDQMLLASEEKVKEILLLVCAMFREKATKPFEMSKAFTDLFGPVDDVFEKSVSLPVTDIDFVCQNILIQDTKAVLIDYEWTFDFSIPVEYVIYRFLYLYLEAKDRSVFPKEICDAIYEQAGIDGKIKKMCEAMETSFQQYVQADAKVLRNEHNANGKPVLLSKDLDEMLDSLEQKKLVLTRNLAGSEMDRASTQGEETEKLFYAKAEGSILRYKIECGDVIAGKKQKITLNGYKADVLLRIGMVFANSNIAPVYETNGKKIGGLIYQFEDQPVLTITLPDDEKNVVLLLSIEEIKATKDATKELLERIEELTFLVDNREQQLEQMRQSASWKVTAPLRKLKGLKE